MKRLIALSVVVLTTACGSGGGGNSGNANQTQTGSVAFNCISVSNDSSQDCKAGATAALTSMKGDVSRSQAMYVSALFTNGTDKPFTGYREITMSPGCNGETEKLVVFGNFVLEPAKSMDNFLSTQCSGMPLGGAQLRAVVYSGEAKRTCVSPPDQVCVTTPDGVLRCTPGDTCTFEKQGPEVDSATAQYMVVN
jgi:hypothetical protein